MTDIQKHLQILNKTYAPNKDKEYKFISNEKGWVRCFSRLKDTQNWYECGRAHPINTDQIQLDGYKYFVISDREANFNLQNSV